MKTFSKLGSRKLLKKSFTLTKTFAKTFQNFQKRRASTVIHPTVFDNKRKVKYPGHIQLQTTKLEQQMFNLKPAYGHAPKLNAPRKLVPVSSKLPSGDLFEVTGVETESIPFHLDKVISRKDAVVIDHGMLTPIHAEKLKKFEFSKIYETSGTKRKNCVHAHAEMMKGLGFDLGEIHPHETPQDLGKRITNIKFSDIKDELV